MPIKKPDESFSPRETKERFEAALRGAKIAGHKPMETITPKKSKPSKKKKSKASA